MFNVARLRSTGANFTDKIVYSIRIDVIGCELRRERAKYRCSEPPENGGKSVWVIALCVWAFSMCGQLLYRGRSMAGFWMV